MKLTPKSCQRVKSGAFTRTDLLYLLMYLGILGLLLAVFVQRRERFRLRDSRINCSNNLKQIGLAFTTWALDNNGCLPMQVSITNGGTMEWVESGGVFPHFQAMSNELGTPKILCCPADPGATSATNFSTGFADANLSYFVGVDPINGDRSQLRCGDKNILTQPSLGRRPVTLANATTTGIAWTKTTHRERGYLLFGNGESEQVRNLTARAVQVGRANSTNRLAVP